MVFLCGPAAVPLVVSSCRLPKPADLPGRHLGQRIRYSYGRKCGGPNSQGITPAAELAKVVQAMREGRLTFNVHSSRSPARIRGPVVVQRDDHHEDDE